MLPAQAVVVTLEKRHICSIDISNSCGKHSVTMQRFFCMNYIIMIFQKLVTQAKKNVTLELEDWLGNGADYPLEFPFWFSIFHLILVWYLHFCNFKYFVFFSKKSDSNCKPRCHLCHNCNCTFPVVCCPTRLSFIFQHIAEQTSVWLLLVLHHFL